MYAEGGLALKTIARYFLLTLFAAGAAGLAADPGWGECTKDPSLYAPGSKIRFIERTPVDRFCYYCSTSVTDDHFANLVFLPLVKPQKMTRDPAPALAASWTVDAEARQVTFQLNPDARWEDGSQVTSADVEATFKAVTDPSSCVRQAYRDAASRITKIEPQGDTAVRFTLKNRADLRLDLFFIFPVLPRFLLTGGINANAAVCTGRGTGVDFASGPYALGEVRAQELTFRYNPNYMAGKCRPYVDDLIMRVVGDRTVWIQMLTNQSVDLLINVPVRYALQVANDLTYETKTYGYLSCVFVAFNYKTQKYKDLFQNTSFRQGMAYAYNRKTVLRKAFAGKGEVLTGPVGEGSSFFNRTVEEIDYSPERAQQKFAAAGLKDYDGDGFLQVKEGEPNLVLRLVVSQSNYTEFENAIKFFEADMERVGLLVETHPENDNKIDEIKAKGDYDLFWERWEFPDGLPVFKAFTKGHENNFFGYSNETVEKNLREAEDTQEKDVFQAFLQGTQKILADDCVCLFLWDLQRIAVHSRRILNLQVSAYNFFDYIEEAYVAAD